MNIIDFYFDAGWWEDFVGPGAAFGIDTRLFRVVAASPLGGPFGSSSPVTIDPATGRRYRASFPQITPADQVCEEKRRLVLESHHP